MSFDFGSGEIQDRLPDVLGDIIRDYIRPEFELTELLKDDLKIFIIGEMKPEMLELLPKGRRYTLGMFSIRWLIYQDGLTWTYDPKIFFDESDEKNEAENQTFFINSTEQYQPMGDEKCYKCGKQIKQSLILIFDTSVYYAYNNGHGEGLPHQYKSLGFRNNYLISCSNCVDSKSDIFNDTGVKVTKSKISRNRQKEIYFVNAASQSPVINLIRHTYKLETEKICYYRGYNRDKFQKTYAVASEHDGETMIEDHIFECGRKNLYNYIKEQLE